MQNERQTIPNNIKNMSNNVNMEKTMWRGWGGLWVGYLANGTVKGGGVNEYEMRYSRWPELLKQEEDMHVLDCSAYTLPPPTSLPQPS